MCASNISPEAAEKDTAPEALVVPTNCLLKIKSVSDAPLFFGVSNVLIASLGNLKRDCWSCGSLNFAPLSTSNSIPVASSSLPICFFSCVPPVAFSESSLSSKNTEALLPSRFSSIMSAVKCSPESDSCISTALASLSLLFIIELIVKSVPLEFCIIKSAFVSSDALIFSPSSNSPITFVK